MRNSDGATDETNYFRGKSRCSECQKDDQAGINSRLRQFHSTMPTRMKPPIYGARNLQPPYEYAVHGFSSPDMTSFKEQTCHHDAALTRRAWPNPSQFNMAEYDHHDCLSQHSGMCHNGGNTPMAEASNPNLMFNPMHSNRNNFVGGDAMASYSRCNVQSRSPAPVSGVCTPGTPSYRRMLSGCEAVHAEESPCIRKQVTLHKWFLVRAPNRDVSITNNVNYIEVCLGGLVRFGPQFPQLVRTSVISERLEKCKLLALDGTEVHLVGCIDEQKTIANGFSHLLANSFLTGFPGNWRYLFTESSAILPPQGDKAGYCFDFDNSEWAAGYKANQIRNVPPVSTTCSELSREGPRQVARQHDFGDGILKAYFNDVQGSEVDCMENEKGKEEAQMFSCSRDPKSFSELHDGDFPLDLKRKLDESSDHVINGTTNYKAGSSELVAKDDAKCQVECDVDKGIVLDVTTSPLPNAAQGSDDSQDGTILKEKNVNPTEVFAGVGCNIDTGTEHGVQTGDLDHPPCTQLQNSVANVCELHKDASSHSQTEAIENGVVELTPILSIVADISLDASKYQECHSDPKVRYSKRLRKEDPGYEEAVQLVQNPNLGRRVAKSGSKASNGNTNSIKEECYKVSNHASEVQDDCVDKSKTMHLQRPVKHQTKKTKASAKHTCVQVSEPFDLPCANEASHNLSQRQGDLVVRCEAMHLQRSVKHQSKKTKASAKQARIQVSKSFDRTSDHEASHHHEEYIHTTASTQGDVTTRSQEVPCFPLEPVLSPKLRRHARPDFTRKMKKTNACGDKASKSQGVTLPVEHVQSPHLRRHTRINSSISKQRQVQLKSSRKTCHHKSSILPPPLPLPRVNVSKDRIMRAYGLKMSRSGRLLVPPLAFWRNQTLAHDMDGTIIAIWEGFVEPPADTGCYNFKPPAEKIAVNLQQELCAAAAVVPNWSKKKKH